MITRKTRQFMLCTGVLSTFLLSTDARCELPSSWIDSGRIMIVYNTTRMDSVDPAEPDTFSRDIAQWYMQRYGMPTTLLFGYDMGTKVRWNNSGAFDFLQTVADYIKRHDIQIVLLAPGTPMIVRDLNDKHNLALDSLAGHALWLFSVFRQLVAGATVTEVMMTSGGSERGGYVTGSIWGDPLYAPFGHNPDKTHWFTGGKD